MKRIVADFDLCTGCEICALVCSFTRLGGFNPDRSCIELNLFADGVFNFPEICHQCSNAVCSQVCPTGAMQIDREAGIVRVDQDSCIACGQCEDACPVDMVKVDQDLNYALKCELCQGEVPCVKACPADALGVYSK